MGTGGAHPGPESERTRDPVAVLVVDDQASFRSVLRDVVARLPGFEVVHEAESGEAAIEAMDERRASLVIMDKRMPGMGGIEACRAVTSRHPEAVIVLCSVEDMDQRVIDQCGAAAVIDKQALSPRALREIWRAYGRDGAEA
ncbi:MAG TPA: response regulator transcription factor [Solirubrobacteraceae bacterium]|nr:response regulator transcription factor [Solirubrobacteraceae bacterium]